jgi:hypothetical protein
MAWQKRFAMAELRTRVPHVPVRRWLLAIVGIAGLIGFGRAFNRRDRRPTSDDLLNMSDTDFAVFVDSVGLKTVTSAGLLPLEGTTD